jgi:hypothetical protein
MKSMSADRLTVVETQVRDNTQLLLELAESLVGFRDDIVARVEKLEAQTRALRSVTASLLERRQAT